MYTVKKDKDEMRSVYRKRRLEIEAAEKARRDEAICRAAKSLASYRYARYILMYAPTEDEIDIMPVAYDAISKGKRIAFPRCHPETHTMDYHFVSSPDELVADSYGILEPSPDAPVFDPAGLSREAVCFVPGLVYDTKGYRLGYGKGFYDRYLSGFSGNAVGIVYSDFVLPEVPRGRFDVSINILLTEKGVMVTGEN